MLNFINREPNICLSADQSDHAIPISLIPADELDGWLDEIDPAQSAWVAANQFNASKGSVLAIADIQGNLNMIAAGAGNGDLSPWDFSKIASALPDGEYYFQTPMNNHQANMAAFGWAMANYKFDHYQKEKKDKNSVLCVPDNCDIDLVNSMVRGTSLVRDLVNTPTCDMGPTELADVSKQLADSYNASYEVIVGDELLQKGYRTIHTVGRAAEKEPRLMDITWGREDAPKVTLVGKGVCFDTGGLDIKPSNAMLTMKKDMGGAAHVMGLAQMIMDSNLDVRLRVLIPAVENNISGNAFRPGDIIKSYKGTTIEVGNTDAEGRLILCDALTLACEEKPDVIIDFATLTGAARVALGADVPPYFTNDDDIRNEFMIYGDKEYDPLWPLPLHKPYKKLLNSPIADTNNVASTGFGGAITAALFLEDFIENGISWVHLDVYAWNAAASSGKPKGGEAMGIRAVYGYLANRFNG